MNVIKDWFTESDNQTWCLARALGAFSVLAFLAVQIYAIVNGEQLKAQEFGLGLGAVWGGLGVALGMKKEAT